MNDTWPLQRGSCSRLMVDFTIIDQFDYAGFHEVLEAGREKCCHFPLALRAKGLWPACLNFFRISEVRHDRA
jgi:hypothetical protein